MQFLLILLGWLGVVGMNLVAAEFNYIYIEANEGNSSGGHVAVQFEDEVFHYQYVEGHLIRLIKQKYSNFEFNYRIIENRGLHISTIEVTEDRYQQLLSFFKQQYQIQNQQFALKNDTDRNSQLLHLMQSSSNDPTPDWTVPGAGLFYTPSDFLTSDPKLLKIQRTSFSTSLEHLKQELGSQKLELLMQQLMSQIRQLKPDLKINSTPLKADQYPARPYHFADHYTDLLTGLLAVNALQQALPLHQKLIDTQILGFAPLTTIERKALTDWRTRLKNSILNLLQQTRPDWGYALFLNYARLIAIDASLEKGYWQIIHTFETHTPNSEQWIYFKDDEYLRPIILELKQKLDSLRVQWAANAINESNYSRLAYQLNRYHELWRAYYHHQISPRLHSDRLLPEAHLSLPLIIKPHLSLQQLVFAEQISNEYQHQIDAELAALYPYHLLTQNCVTEIWTALDQPELNKRNNVDIFAAPLASVFKFIPVVSPWSIQKQESVTRQLNLPSFRNQQLKDMYAEEGIIPVYLRENNTFSATRYYRNPKDSFFIFFTDNELILRPFYGAFNTVAALSQVLFGMIHWPQDQGYHMRSGLKGVLMSIPELFFVNLRKGSYPYLSPSEITSLRHSTHAPLP